MNVLRAMEDTIQLMELRMGLGTRPGHTMRATGEAGTIHLHSMLSRMQTWGDAKEPALSGKANRWLGYTQGALVQAGLADLDDVKGINVKYEN